MPRKYKSKPRSNKKRYKIRKTHKRSHYKRVNHTKKRTKKTKRTRRRNNKRGGSRIREAYDSATKYLSESRLGQSLKNSRAGKMYSNYIKEIKEKEKERVIDKIVKVMECGVNPKPNQLENFNKQAREFALKIINQGKTPEEALVLAEKKWPGCTEYGTQKHFLDRGFADWNFVAPHLQNKR